MTQATDPSITRMLDELRLGDRAALDGLFPLVYEELRWLAHQHRRGWCGDETLGTTVLVHEAYLKLVGQRRIRAESRAHFLAVAARAMRHILINYARGRMASKRGGDVEKVSLDQYEELSAVEADLSPDKAEALVMLDEALRALEQTDARQGKVVECRFFGGMSIEETAAALGISARTVKRDWSVAQAWLHRRMEQLNG